MKRIALITFILLLAVSCFVFSQHARVDFTIVNNTGFTIYAIHLSSPGQAAWGNDLSSHLLPPGHTFNVWTTRGNVVDILLIDTDGDQFIKYNVPIHNGARIVFTMADFQG